jgi:hypothetical protein
MSKRERASCDCSERVWNETLGGQVLYIYDKHAIGLSWVVRAPRWTNIIHGGHYSVPASVN